MNLDEFIRRNEKQENFKEKTKIQEYHPQLSDEIKLHYYFPADKSIRNHSLTTLLRAFQNKENILSPQIKQFSFSTIPTKIVNPYPNWINFKQQWANFGTFTDYVIRKILQLNFSNGIIKEGPLVAEIAAELIDKMVELEPHMELIVPYLKDRHLWIEKYKQSENIKDALIPVANMIRLDNFFRNGNLDPQLVFPKDPKQLFQCLKFFNNIESFLIHEFPSPSQIILNPPLGNNHYFKGDADLIIDDLLIDIKTVRSPLKYVNNEKEQLFGYVSMQTWLQSFQSIDSDINSTRYPSLNCSRIKKIAFLWPLHLSMSIASITKWTDSQRFKFLSELRNQENYDFS